MAVFETLRSLFSGGGWVARRLMLPPTVPLSHARHYRLHVVSAWAFVVGHGALGAVFLALGQPWLALVYVGSIAVNLVALALGRRGRWQLGSDLNFYEFMINVTVMSYLLGLKSGFVLYFALGPLTSFLFVSGDARRRVAFPVLSYGFGAIVLATASAPVVSLPPWGPDTLFALNAAACCQGVIAFGVFGSLFIDHSERLLAEEKERSERLLRNILPDEIASRLKSDSRPIADDVAAVSVLFADIVGFTRLAARIPSQELVGMLNDLFSAFDDLTEKHGLEKIKTIGDAYMVVAGAPRAADDHAGLVAALGLEMLSAVRDYASRTGRAIDVRIGIHSGPVVAGVIGVKKLAYDLWGDTVNLASRMESHGVPGRIQLTGATAELLAGRYPLVERGPVEVKGVGEVRTFFLDP